MSFTVLGFVGESSSGKDFCGEWVVREKKFVRVAFADTLKRFLQVVFGFDHCHLWGDQKYKHEPIIPHQDGKASASDFMHLYWDRALEQMTLGVHDWVNELALTTLEKAEFVKVVGHWFDECREKTKGGKISLRMAIQLLGTNYGRAYKYNIWVDHLHKNVIPRIRNGDYYTKECGFIDGQHIACSGIVITDHRYLNEIRGTQNHEGYVIKLIRLANEGKVNEAEKAGIDNHSSEVEQRGIPDKVFDLILKMGEGKEHVYPRLERMFQEQEWQRKRNKERLASS